MNTSITVEDKSVRKTWNPIRLNPRFLIHKCRQMLSTKTGMRKCDKLLKYPEDVPFGTERIERVRGSERRIFEASITIFLSFQAIPIFSFGCDCVDFQ